MPAKIDDLAVSQLLHGPIGETQHLSQNVCRVLAKIRRRSNRFWLRANKARHNPLHPDRSNSWILDRDDTAASGIMGIGGDISDRVYQGIGDPRVIEDLLHFRYAPGFNPLPDTAVQFINMRCTGFLRGISRVILPVGRSHRNAKTMKHRCVSNGEREKASIACFKMFGRSGCGRNITLALTHLPELVVSGHDRFGKAEGAFEQRNIDVLSLSQNGFRTSGSGVAPAFPALLTRISIAPNAFSVFATIALTDARSVTSACAAIAFPQQPQSRLQQLQRARQNSR